MGTMNANTAGSDTGDLIKWGFLSLSYAEFHQEEENFTKFVTVFSEDLFEFHARLYRTGRNTKRNAVL